VKLPEVAGLALAFVARLITGAQGHWHGAAPKAEQRIYFANHQSHFDWVLIWAALPRELRAVTRPIAARDTYGAAFLQSFNLWRVDDAVRQFVHFHSSAWLTAAMRFFTILALRWSCR